MFQRIIYILLLACSFIILSFGLVQAQEPLEIPPELVGKLDPRLIKQLAQPDDAQARIMIVLKEKANLTAARSQSGVVARRQAVIDALRVTATQSQAGVRAVLSEAEKQQRASDIHSLWIVNQVAAQADWQTVLDLAARDEVQLVRLEEIITVAPTNGQTVSQVETDLEWGIEMIQAQNVWQALGIDGSGVIVATMDTGADFLHPTFSKKYRGYRGDTLPPQHTGNWYDATGKGATYPVDSNGHGTHVLGTIIGDEGIGVAPGAKWMAVQLFDSSDSARESWIHDGFQWLLAPDGNPALAPHVVNNSWGSDNGFLTLYQEDIERLIDANIIPIFAAGNNGPAPETVGSPASHSPSFAIGAVDNQELIAIFSSRGPSPWGEIKPDISAPGVQILSSWPGGGYQRLNGTSMATPHVVGTVALMLQADPTLTYEQVGDILRSTAKPLGSPLPNNTYGWGLLNAYNAVRTALNAGTITGLVTDQIGGQPIPNATLIFTRRGSGEQSQVLSDATGRYDWAGMAGDYDLTATAFGYQTQTQPGLSVMTDSLTTLNIALPSLPAGSLTGVVRNSETTLPLSATITVEDTPVVAQAGLSGGNYNISLPADTYTITVRSPNHRIVTIPNLTVNVSQATSQDISLDPAPSILLVDSGRWYNRSQISYYEQALNEARYYYDLHSIVKNPEHVPITSTLTAYDIVIWSSPNDSPGSVGAGRTLETYLAQGGNLILSGQDVALFDGSTSFIPETYYLNYLYANQTTDAVETDRLKPTADSIFSGLEITISGGDGANNQTVPDEIEIRNEDFVETTLIYDQAGDAGHQVGHCLPYRAINLAFGLEAVSSHVTRTDMLQRSIDWLQSPPRQSGLELTPLTETKTTAPGETVEHTFRVRNLAEVGSPDQIQLTLSTSQWPTDFPTTVITLAPCQSQWVTFSVTVPANTLQDAKDTITVTAQSTLAPQIQTVITRVSKAPAAVLLVDDDRWFDYGPDFQQALAANNIPFDYWDVGGGNPEGSPPLDTLKRYPIVLWFTGYDWFNPLTRGEENRLQQYLDRGGRLALTSQEYLYRLPEHRSSPFAQNYLGVYTHSEVLSSTLAMGVNDHAIGNALGPYILDYPPGYLNWSDSLTPTETAEVAFLSQDGFANALTHRGGLTETWHTAFFGFGLEVLPEPYMADVVGRTIGWLSWLGTSTVKADVSQAENGDRIRYTAVLRNDGLETIDTAIFTATFSYPLTLMPGSATGGGIETNGELSWQGTLAKNQAITLTYEAVVDGSTPYGTLSKQVSWLTHQEQGIRFNRVAAVPVNYPEWKTSQVVVTPALLNQADVVSYTFTVTNTGLADAPVVTVTTEIPPYLHLITDTITANRGTMKVQAVGAGFITWVAPVQRDQPLVVGYTARLAALPFPFQLPSKFTLNDGLRPPQVWQTATPVNPYKTHFPQIFREIGP